MNNASVPVLIFVLLINRAFAAPTTGTVLEPMEKIADKPNLDAAFVVPELVEVRVRHGESLYLLARWSGVAVEAIEEMNGIDLGHPLKGGQNLIIPMTREQSDRLAAARDLFANQRKDNYLARRGGLVEVQSYRLKTGDTVWKVARSHGRLPTWLIKAFNPGVNINRVRIGQRVFIPIVGDMVSPDEPCAPPGPEEGC